MNRYFRYSVRQGRMSSERVELLSNSSENTRTVPKAKNVTVTTAVFIILGEMIGGGCLAMPYAIVTSGVPGLFIILLVGLASCYGGMKLGRCWQIVVERWPEYGLHTNDPYAVIGDVCFGRIAREFVRMNVNVMLTGCTVVLLLLASQLGAQLTSSSHLCYCDWIIIFSAIMIFPSWLQSPKDFWPAAIFAVFTAVIPIIVIMVELVMEAQHETTQKQAVTVWAMLQTYSTVVFINGSSATYPTIQNDMEDKKRFPMAVALASIGIIGTYFTIGVISYETLGPNINPNFVVSLNYKWYMHACRLLLIIHIVIQCFILMNPVYQDFEKLCKVPKDFSWKRAAARTFLVFIIYFIGHTMPKFDFVLNVVGGTAVSFLSFIFPASFYLKLTSMEPPPGVQWPRWQVPKFEKIFLVFLIVVAFIGGVLSTGVAIYTMASGAKFALPCYVNMQLNCNV